MMPRPSIGPEAVTFIGEGLARPECVLATERGDLFAADWRGGVTHVCSDGSQVLYSGDCPDISGTPRPNGIALEKTGSFLFAHLGEEQGGLFRLTRGGAITPVLIEVEGAPLPPSNFPLLDSEGRIWLSISTRKVPRALAYRNDIQDGFIVLVDWRGARVVAEGLGYTNEIQLDRAGEHLYVNETFARRTTRFTLQSDGTLGNREVVAEYGRGVFPDGLAFDSEGGLWVTSIISNSVIRVGPDGRMQTYLRDANERHVDDVENHFSAGNLGRGDLDRIEGTRLRNISSLAFGGPDLRTGFLGSLLNEAIARIPLPVEGVPPVHWKW